ncbi:hypothetical protein Tco_0520140 [Tanacetum coccineum]
MLSKFICSNTASSSNSSTLPSQTVTNPREHANAITTRSGKSCEGPSTPLVSTPVVSTPLNGGNLDEPEQDPETSTDKVKKPSSKSSAQVPPPEDHDSIFIEIPKPKAKKTVQEPNSLEPDSYQPKLQYPERVKVRGKDKPKCSVEQKRKNKQFSHAISVIDFSKDEPFCGSTTIHSDALPPSSSPVNTSDNLEEFTDELTLFKKGVHEKKIQAYSNPLFEFDDNFTSSNVNPLFNEMDEDVENKNSNVSNSDEPVFLNTPLSDKVECSDPEDDIDEICFSKPWNILSYLRKVITIQKETSDPLHHEFAGEIITLPSRNVREHEEYLKLMTLLCKISTSQSPKNLPASPIPVEDSDPVQEEIDIFLVPDDVIPPGVKNDDSEDEDNSTFLPEQ